MLRLRRSPLKLLLAGVLILGHIALLPGRKAAPSPPHSAALDAKTVALMPSAAPRHVTR